MTDSYQQEIDQMLGEYQRHLAGLADLQQRMKEVSATVQAPRRVVSVTAGHQGEIIALTFPTAAYRLMAPAELAAVLRQTINEARGKAVAQVAEMITPYLPAGTNVTDLLNGSMELDAFLPEEPPTLDGARTIAPDWLRRSR